MPPHPSLLERLRDVVCTAQRLKIRFIIEAACAQGQDVVYLFACSHYALIQAVGAQGVSIQPSASTAHACVASQAFGLLSLVGTLVLQAKPSLDQSRTAWPGARMRG